MDVLSYPTLSSGVAKTVIVSDDTARQLIEAYASMAAWYYKMAQALREAGVSVEPPSDAQRLGFVAAFGQHFPELAHLAKTIDAPRAYLPPPIVEAPAEVVENADIVATALPPADPSDAKSPPPPAIVDPNKVKYE